MKANISEIFYSAQGEGKYIGVAQVFIRLSGCPFDCPYCDTNTLEQDYFEIHGNKYINPLSVSELADIVIKEFGDGSNFHSYSITGGEPLVEFDYVLSLAKALKQRSKAKLFLETSGLIIDHFQELDGIFDIMSIDIKTHSEKSLNNLEKLLFNVTKIKKSDYYFKLLLPQEKVYDIIDYTAEVLYKYNVKSIIVQPVDSIISKDILDYLYNKYYINNIEARVIPQTHKILSIP